MSGLNALISGAECGPSNALSQVVKHAEADRSLQRDRIGGPSSANLRHLPFSINAGPSSADEAYARQFFENNGGPSSINMPSASPFPAALHSPEGIARNHMNGLEANWRGQGPPPPDMQAFHMARPMNAADSKWSAEFNSRGSPASTAGPSSEMFAHRIQNTVEPIYNPSMAQQYMYGGMNGMASMYSAPQMMGQVPAPLAAVSQQADWDREFSRLSESESVVVDKGKGKLVEVDALAGALQDTTLSEPNTGSLEDYMTSFEKVWQDIKRDHENNGTSLEEIARQEDEYRQVLQQQEELAEFENLEQLNAAWRDDHGLGDEEDPDFGLNNMYRFDDAGVPILEPYAFESHNPFVENPPQGPLLELAKQILASSGSLHEAALLLEAAIQNGELGVGGYEAWILLGQARSMDEREVQALKALREGTQIAKASGAPDAGLMELAISYTNESFDLAAHLALRNWLKIRYPMASYPEHPESSYKTPWSSHKNTSEAYLAVARDLYAKGQDDPDVQIGLGVLYYSNGEYEKSKDCFESALASRPEDYLLWNRLGSSLSNGSKPEEALGAYREALNLRPTYTRAIYNVGVACLNIGAHKEAAEHFMSALTLRGQDRDGPEGVILHDKKEEQKNDQLWQTLTRTFVAMERPDLVQVASAGDVEAFRQHGFDF